jgi:hypothetical protein
MSLDPDATREHGVGGSARGYQSHAVWTIDALVECEIPPLGVSEQTVARRGVDLMETASRCGAGAKMTRWAL